MGPSGSGCPQVTLRGLLSTRPPAHDGAGRTVGRDPFPAQWMSGWARGLPLAGGLLVGVTQAGAPPEPMWLSLASCGPAMHREKIPLGSC